MNRRRKEKELDVSEQELVFSKYVNCEFVCFFRRRDGRQAVCIIALQGSRKTKRKSVRLFALSND